VARSSPGILNALHAVHRPAVVQFMKTDVGLPQHAVDTGKRSFAVQHRLLVLEDVAKLRGQQEGLAASGPGSW